MKRRTFLKGISGIIAAPALLLPSKVPLAQGGGFFFGDQKGFASDPLLKSGGGAGAAAPPDDFFQILTDLSLTGNLEVCLDAGDGDSFTSGQKWRDTSGNGYDFYLGADGSAASDDPTHNGTPDARTSSEFFGTNGDDIFRLDQANPAGWEAFHKNSGAFSVAMVFNPGTHASTARIVGNNAAANANTGWEYGMNATPTNTMTFRISEGSSWRKSQSSVAAAVDSTFNFLSIAFDEAGGAGASHHRVNATTETFDGAVTSPPTGNAAYTLEILAAGNAAGIFPNTGEIACFAMWSTALTTTETGNIRTQIMDRFT